MTPPPGTPLMDIGEFVRDGYLHEVNRRFLHPLGLALEITTEDFCFHCGGNGREPTDNENKCLLCQGSRKRPDEEITYTITGVWDDRGDPEGIYMAPETLSDQAKVNIDRLWKERRLAREQILGFMVQPTDGERVAAALIDA